MGSSYHSDHPNSVRKTSSIKENVLHLALRFLANVLDIMDPCSF